jgi:ADP-ribose pyrophosphatase YjhB (NUDIX family)
MDTEKTQITKQAKVSVLMFASKEINNKTYFLVYTRLKQPFYGAQGLVSGKVSWGEKIVKAAERELFEETGLKGKATIARMRHYMVINKESEELLDDKMMFFCIFRNPTGEIIASDEGKYEWVPCDKIDSYVSKSIEENLEALFNSLHEFNGTQLIEEVTHITDKF